MLQKLKDLWTKSWSRFWGWFQVTLGAVALGWQHALPYLSSMLNDPEVKVAMTALAVPTYIALGIALLGVITLVARSHN